jgi:hypothetical protein
MARPAKKAMIEVEMIVQLTLADSLHIEGTSELASLQGSRGLEDQGLQE